MTRYAVSLIWRGECAAVIAARDVVHVEARSEAAARAAARRVLRAEYVPGGEVAGVEVMATVGA